MNKLFWAKVKENAIIPTKIEEDGGYDLYACVDGDIQINPHTMEIIPLGIASAFDSDYVCILKERGSTGVKNMRVGAGVMDSGFRNEWCIIINNTTDKPILISDTNNHDGNVTVYDKSKAIGQAVFVPLAIFDKIETISYEDLLKIKSIRGLGMLGHSGK